MTMRQKSGYNNNALYNGKTTKLTIILQQLYGIQQLRQGTAQAAPHALRQPADRL